MSADLNTVEEKFSNNYLEKGYENFISPSSISHLALPNFYSVFSTMEEQEIGPEWFDDYVRNYTPKSGAYWNFKNIKFSIDAYKDMRLYNPFGESFPLEVSISVWNNRVFRDFAHLLDKERLDLLLLNTYESQSASTLTEKPFSVIHPDLDIQLTAPLFSIDASSLASVPPASFSTTPNPPLAGSFGTPSPSVYKPNPSHSFI